MDRGLLGDFHLDGKMKIRTASCYAVDRQLSSHGIDQPLADRKAEPGAPELARDRAVRLREPLEYRSMASASMPIPVSRTWISMRLRDGALTDRQELDRDAPVSVNFKALLTKFQ